MSHSGNFLLAAAVVAGATFLIVRGELARRSGRVPDARPAPQEPAPQEPAPQGTAASDAMAAAAMLSVGAAVIHALVVAEHFEESSLFGIFFVSAAVLQAAWAIALWRKPSRGLLVAGVIGNALVAAIWALSRTTGLPVGPEPWEAEPVGLADTVSTLFEAGIVVLAVVALRSRSALSFVRPVLARTLPAVTAGAAIGLTYLAAVAGGGHH